MKKRIAIIAAMICLFSLLFTLPVMAAADSKAPTLKTLTLKKTSMKAPGEIEVVGTATDDNSGVNSFYVRFESEELGESISCGLSKTYWDTKTYKEVAYADGKYHGFLKADEYQESGTFKIDYVSVSDKAGNSSSYYREPWSTSHKALPEKYKSLKFTVKATNPDGTPPVFKTLSLAKTSMKAPGEIEVIGTATDDNSGVNSFYVRFESEELGESISCGLSKTYWDTKTYKEVAYADGKYHGFLKADEYQESGTFKIDYVSVSDKAGNSSSYYREPWSTSHKALPEKYTSLKFTVKEETKDTKAPTLKTLSLAKTSMKAPGEIEVIGTATDDNSGVNSFYVRFESEELGESISCGLSKTYWDTKTYKEVAYADGKYHGFLKADEYQESGTFKIDYVSVSDKAGNSSSYYREPWSTSHKALPEKYTSLKFKVTNESSPLAITTQPKTTYTQSGSVAKATVKATGDGLKYTWYVKNAGASQYAKSSVTKSTYSVTMSSKTKDRLLYCIVTDKYGKKVQTKTVTMHMAASVTTQPKTTYTKSGSVAKVTVKAAGDGLKYTWYVKNKGASKYAKSSVTKPTYSVTMSSKTKDRLIYCIVTDKYGKKVQTKTVTLHMAATITSQPKTVTVAKNKTAKVTVKAAGDGLTYTWYVKNAGASKFSKSSVKTSAYSVKMTSSTKGRQVYCVVKDKYGKTVKSSTATLRMK